MTSPDSARRPRNAKMDALLHAVNGSPAYDIARVQVTLSKSLRAAQEQRLQALASETGVDVAVLRTLAAISDPDNRHLFTAEAARQAFSKVPPKP